VNRIETRAAGVQVAAAWVGWSIVVVAQVARGHDPKRADGRQRARFRAAGRVLTVARVAHDLALTSARQIEVAHERVAQVPLTPIAIRPPLVIAVTRVSVCVLAVGAWSTAKVRTAIIVTIPIALAAPPAFVVPIARIVAAAEVKHVALPTGFHPSAVASGPVDSCW
jgi:hypothetical protein